jgi:hypothetical protein
MLAGLAGGNFHRDDTLLECLRVRAHLEPAATAMAAERIAEEVSDGLRASTLSMTEPGPSSTTEPGPSSTTEHRAILDDRSPGHPRRARRP